MSNLKLDSVNSRRLTVIVIFVLLSVATLLFVPGISDALSGAKERTANSWESIMNENTDGTSSDPIIPVNNVSGVSTTANLNKERN